MCKAADFSPEDYPRIMRDNRPRRYDRHSEVRYSVISDEDHKTVTLVVIGACTKLVHEVVAWSEGLMFAHAFRSISSTASIEGKYG